MSGVEFPQNELTRLIETNAAMNRAGGRGVASATPLPTVRSADMTQPPADEPPPLTLEERAELDRLAREAGVVDESLGVAKPQGAYDSMEAAIEAGKPVAVERVTAQSAREFIADRQVRRGEHMVARSHSFVPPPTAPRLPDFRNVEGIDLMQGRVMIDGMEFPMPPEDVRSYRQYVVNIARAAVQKQLDDALRLAEPEVTDGGSEIPGAIQKVQPVAEGRGEEPSC